MNPYFVYLLSELSRFSDLGCSKEFLKGYKDYLTPYNFPKGNEKYFNDFFSDIENIEVFIKRLTFEKYTSLAKLLSVNWRDNCVYDRISESNSNNWAVADFPISDLYTSVQAEWYVAHIFERNNFKIIEIAKDKELYKHEPYSAYQDDHKEINYAILLARKIKGKIYIFDGVHRALKMAYLKKDKARICYF